MSLSLPVLSPWFSVYWFLTGVTEPVEFTFMFLAPILYAIHAVLTGISMALMNFLGVRLGFTFSAGAFDYIISYRLATPPYPAKLSKNYGRYADAFRKGL